MEKIEKIWLTDDAVWIRTADGREACEKFYDYPSSKGGSLTYPFRGESALHGCRCDIRRGGYRPRVRKGHLRGVAADRGI